MVKTENRKLKAEIAFIEAVAEMAFRSAHMIGQECVIDVITRGEELKSALREENDRT
jgi:hypothetical protein